MMGQGRCEVLSACQCPRCRPLGDDDEYRETWRHETPPFLCIDRRLHHLESEEHINNVVAFLTARGLTEARTQIDKYGIRAADSAAAELDAQELAGQDWRKGLKNPGGYVHALIRRKAGVRTES